MVGARELPTGTVTLLFTDIDGSTELVKGLREHYHDVLASHRDLLRAAVAEHRGTEVDTQGDAFFVAFEQARDAAAAAVAAQRALGAKGWPGDVRVHVRMGLHTTEPHLREDRYVGVGVHRAARLCTAAHGGQVLLSGATAAIVEDELASDVKLRDLGEHRLKDIPRPERIFQLDALGLPQDFPPLRIAQVPLTGTLTTVFTDIRGARSHTAALGSEAFDALLVEYHRLMQRVLHDAGGREFEFAFDSAMAAFPTARHAALAAVAAQEALAQHDWPVAKPLEMTVALHSSEAGVGWLGPAVYRCAELCEVGRGGQILLSHATAALLGDQELGKLCVRAVGKARVGGEKQRVYELAAARSGRRLSRYFAPSQTL